jgi:hypothetical protein
MFYPPENEMYWDPASDYFEWIEYGTTQNWENLKCRGCGKIGTCTGMRPRGNRSGKAEYENVEGADDEADVVAA